MKRHAALLCLPILLAACSGAPAEPPAPPPLNPAGTYDIAIEAEGMSMAGTLTIEGSPDAGYSGYISTDMGGADITNVTVEGQTVTFEVNIPEAQILFEVVFDGDAFSGGFDGTMGAGTISGKKRQG